MNRMKKLIFLGMFAIYSILAIIGALAVSSAFIPSSKPTKFVALDYVDKNGNMKYETGYVTESDYRKLNKEKASVQFYTYDIIYTDDIKSYSIR